MQEVLTVIDDHTQSWPATEEWLDLLPSWFVNACAPPRSAEEEQEFVEKWRRMSTAEKAAATANRPWTLNQWLYWLAPEQRQWRWVNGTLVSPDLIRATLDVDGWPTALGAFNWLARAAEALGTEVA
jgi:hypothetical protein